MTRYHATVDGRVPFTPEEEAASDAEKQAWADGASARAAEAIQGKRRAAYREEAARDAEEKADADGAPASAAERIQVSRRAAYVAEADTLFFEEQAGEVAAGTWAAKRAEIKARFPK